MDSGDSAMCNQAASISAHAFDQRRSWRRGRPATALPVLSSTVKSSCAPKWAPWPSRHALSSQLTLEVGPRQIAAGTMVNNDVLATARERVFIGTEARDLEALRGLGPVEGRRPAHRLQRETLRA